MTRGLESQHQSLKWERGGVQKSWLNSSKGKAEMSQMGASEFVFGADPRPNCLILLGVVWRPSQEEIIYNMS